MRLRWREECEQPNQGRLRIGGQNQHLFVPRRTPAWYYLRDTLETSTRCHLRTNHHHQSFYICWDCGPRRRGAAPCPGPARRFVWIRKQSLISPAPQYPLIAPLYRLFTMFFSRDRSPTLPPQTPTASMRLFLKASPQIIP